MNIMLHGTGGNNGKYITRAALNPTTGKVQLWEAPDERGTYTFTGKDGNGKPFTWTRDNITGTEANDTYTQLRKNVQDVEVKGSEIRKNNAEANKADADAKKANADSEEGSDRG
jgi:hypothetical protein